jgi:hypothetical protein
MHALADELEERPFTHVVIDEAQDIAVPELRLVAAIAGGRAGRDPCYISLGSPLLRALSQTPQRHRLGHRSLCPSRPGIAPTG